jgi:serine/threonine kinase 32
VLTTIGKGAFGSVKAIQDKKTKKKYALKFINKNHCIEDKATELVFKERIMLQELSHTFIIALKYAFQDDEHLFMVLEWALGGDLRCNMFKCPIFDEHTLVVYTAEISSAVSYMHSKMIIHR